MGAQLPTRPQLVRLPESFRLPLLRRSAPHNTLYCFETWGEQLRDFIIERVGQPATLSCNSVGGELEVGAPHGLQLVEQGWLCPSGSRSVSTRHTVTM